jgi:hypothetical protein
MAAVSLYGAVKQQDLVDIFNMQNEIKPTLTKCFPSLSNLSPQNWDTASMMNYIVDNSFADDDFEDFYELSTKQPRSQDILPEKEEFLRYADLDYYEQNPQTLALKNYIRKTLPMCETDPLLADDLVDEIVYLCRKKGIFKALIDLLEDYDLRFNNEKQAKQFFTLVIDVQNNVRLWAKKWAYPAGNASIQSGRPELPAQAGGAAEKRAEMIPVPAAAEEV